MSVLRKIVIFCFFPAAPGLLAQVSSDSLLRLEEVSVEANRLYNFTVGSKVQKIDQGQLQNFSSSNLSDILAQQSQVFIKSYGPGSLATPSFRGTNANHTAVLWNGFNIQQPTLGQTDFSMAPISFIDEIDIQYGGGSALYGSGAVGGTIHLNTGMQYDKGFNVTAYMGFGSFNTYNQSLRLKYSKKKWAGSIRYFNRTADNNFPFVNTSLPGAPRMRQENSKIAQMGVLQENYFKINAHQQLNLKIWLQQNDRQNPPLMSDENRRTSSVNNFLRLSSEWKRQGDRVTYFIRTAYFNELYVYKDIIESSTTFHSSISEIESSIHLNTNQHLNIGINNTYNQAVSEGYPDAPRQNRTALFASYKIQNTAASWRSVLSAREEYFQGRLLPITPSLGVDGIVTKGISVKANVSRTYRLPTFNDLYWQPGGNPKLRPETGWSEELTVVAKPVYGKFKSNVSATVFNSNIRDWLMWLPSGNQWYAMNIASVWARGLEGMVKMNTVAQEWKLQLSISYSYVLSTNQKMKSVNDNSLHKQLIYVPVYSAQGNLGLTYKKNSLNYAHGYTGNRFITSDNSEILSGYQLGSLTFSKIFETQKMAFNFNLQVNNLWNTAYQSVASQAMPLRSYQVGISVNFNKPNKS